MTQDEKEIRRKLRVLEHAQGIGNVAKTCRYYGIPRSLFYVWRKAYQMRGLEGLKNKKPIPKSHPKQTPAEVVEKILYLRKKYHLGPTRIMWYMARYHQMRVSGATIYRVLKRHGMSRLSGSVNWARGVNYRLAFGLCSFKIAIHYLDQISCCNIFQAISQAIRSCSRRTFCPQALRLMD